MQAEGTVPALSNANQTFFRWKFRLSDERAIGKEPKRACGPFLQEALYGLLVIGIYKIIILRFRSGIGNVTVAKCDKLRSERQFASSF